MSGLLRALRRYQESRAARSRYGDGLWSGENSSILRIKPNKMADPTRILRCRPKSRKYVCVLWERRLVVPHAFALNRIANAKSNHDMPSKLMPLVDRLQTTSFSLRVMLNLTAATSNVIVGEMVVETRRTPRSIPIFTWHRQATPNSDSATGSSRPHLPAQSPSQSVKDVSFTYYHPTQLEYAPMLT